MDCVVSEGTITVPVTHLKKKRKKVMQAMGTGMWLLSRNSRTIRSLHQVHLHDYMRLG